MSLQEKSAAALLYNLRYSKTIVGLEIFFHVLVFIAILQSPGGWWLLAMLALFFLIAIRFFAQESIHTQFPRGSRMEIRHKPPRLIWYDHDHWHEYDLQQLRCIMTRWFVLLQFGPYGNRNYKLLLADSFDDKSHYTRFRRQLIEMNLC